MTVAVTGGPLSVADVVAVAIDRLPVRMDAGVTARMAPSRAVVESVVASDRPVYGITTGFGALAATRVSPGEAAALQVNLLRSHAAGVGPPLPPDLVRAMLLLRARTLAQGHSGVRPMIVERLIDMLNRDFLPVVPAQGSVGASGDLAPFAHLALPLIGEGMVALGGEVMDAPAALARAGWPPITLEAKEGISLLNGTEGMLAMGVLGLDRARRLARAADVACAMSVEALMGSARPFRPEVHALRPHPGQIESARRIAGLVAGSEIGSSHENDFVHAVQDAYCLRCAPQVHGAVLDTLAHATSVLETELGSVVDNPIVFPENDEVISAGNFHGQPLAFVLDFMGIAMTELGSISERRTDRMLDPQHSAGLPPFLSSRAGMNSGYMLAQYTAAALVAENRVLSHPASVESIPTSGSQEDHVSMGWGAGRKLGQILDNTTRVLAIEVMCATQGIEYRRPARPSAAIARIVAGVREVIPTLSADRVISGDIEAVARLIQDGSLDRHSGLVAV
ncbi:MAG TPA: histidine ammonia-lyase [Acidimicrobiia bacterium]